MSPEFICLGCGPVWRNCR